MVLFHKSGERFGSVDLTILENRHYNEAWRYIHTMPEEVLQASKDQKAGQTFPVHSGKFDLGGHAWNEPLMKITQLNKQFGQTLITPVIGVVVELDRGSQVFQKWWENVK